MPQSGDVEMKKIINKTNIFMCIELYHTPLLFGQYAEVTLGAKLYQFLWDRVCSTK